MFIDGCIQGPLKLVSAFAPVTFLRWLTSAFCAVTVKVQLRTDYEAVLSKACRDQENQLKYYGSLVPADKDKKATAKER